MGVLKEFTQDQISAVMLTQFQFGIQHYQMLPVSPFHSRIVAEAVKQHPLLAETTNPTRNKERYTQGLMRNNARASFISLVSSRNKPNSVRSKARLSPIGMSLTGRLQ